MICVSQIFEKISIKKFSGSDGVSERPLRRSIHACVFVFVGAAFSWKVKQQSVVAQSCLKSVYVALFRAVSEALWNQTFRNKFLTLNGSFEISSGEGSMGHLGVLKNEIPPSGLNILVLKSTLS